MVEAMEARRARAMGTAKAMDEAEEAMVARVKSRKEMAERAQEDRKSAKLKAVCPLDWRKRQRKAKRCHRGLPKN